MLTYLEKRRTQITYREFVAAGYPIGSGIVESANKQVPEARLKGSGMHWARVNVNPMLALRAAVCSGRWEQVWPPIWHGLRQRHTSRACCRADPEAATPEGTPTDQPAQHPRSERLPQIKLPHKGLMLNGRPTANHPWKRAPLSRLRPEPNAKL